MTTTFKDLGLSEDILTALSDVGYDSPSPIQEQAIPHLLQGHDVIGQAQTGTGKTAAFGLPMVQFVDPSEQDVQALVLTPTRELCIQVTQALRAYAKPKGIEPVAVFGGAPIRDQQARLKTGGQIVVGTVGRVLDLISRHSLVLHSCRYVVLDEADEMLDLGFLEDVEKILGHHAERPPDRAVQRDDAAADRAARRQVPLRPGHGQGQGGDADDRHRRAVLRRDLAARQDRDARPRARVRAPSQAIVFCRTKIRCDQLYRTLRDKGMNVKALHGDMTQGGRDGVMISFKDGRVQILVATDVAARGLDISTVTHIVNFDVPNSPDIYVHRIGRTGRIGRSGRAITFIEPKQKRDLEAIEAHANTKIAMWEEGAKVDAGAGHRAQAAPPHAQAARRRARPRRQRRLPGADRGLRPRRRPVGGRPHRGGARRRLDGEHIRNVRLLERFALLEVPEAEADRVVDAVNAANGLRLEVARA